MNDVRIPVGRFRLHGKVLVPSEASSGRPGLLFLHGWGGSQRRDVREGKKLLQLGYVCLTFNLRGHARTRRHVQNVTRAQNLRDALAAYDVLAGRPDVDPERIGVVGMSYGGYLATLLTSERRVRWLALRAPALYKDQDFDRPKRELNLDPELQAYRRRPLAPSENRVLVSASTFAGDVLVVESEDDVVIPYQVIVNYVKAFTEARSVTHEILHGADHALSAARSRRAYATLLLKWFGERVSPTEKT
jgi:hypothetical protein